MTGSIIILLVISLVICSKISLAEHSVFVEWVALNFTWDADHTYDNYIKSDKFLPQNNALAGINVDRNGEIYVTVPRWRAGVPATLNKLEKASDSDLFTLSPFPSWDMQEEGKEGDLQNCQSMTIDSKNRMWVIETGRRNFLSILEKTWVDGAAGVWIIDIDTRAILNKYYFPPEVASYDVSFVNDIVLDESRDLAYLSDAGGDGGLIVYDRKSGTSRRYSGPSTKNDPSYVMVIDGVNYGNSIFTTPSDGIAITDDLNALLYSAVQGETLYRVPAAVLRNFSTTSAEVDKAVQVIGKKNPSDGMKYYKGMLFYGDLPQSTLHVLPVTATSYPNITIDASSSVSDPKTLRWIDTFAIDLSNSSQLWFVSNKLDLFITYTMDFSGNSGANFRINRVSLS